LETLRAVHELVESGPDAHRALLNAIVAGHADAAAQAADEVIRPSLRSLQGVLGDCGEAVGEPIEHTEALDRAGGLAPTDPGGEACSAAEPGSRGTAHRS